MSKRTFFKGFAKGFDAFGAFVAPPRPRRARRVTAKDTWGEVGRFMGQSFEAERKKIEKSKAKASS